MRAKPRIKTFRWHEGYMAIDWDDMKSAFDITAQYGDAGLFVRPVKSPGLGIHGAISAHKVRQFVLRPDPETGLAEVILEVTYGSGEECLGLTDKAEEAERWVADANELVRRARERGERKG